MPYREHAGEPPSQPGSVAPPLGSRPWVGFDSEPPGPLSEVAVDLAATPAAERPFVRRLLERRHAATGIYVVAAVLVLSSLGCGFMADDYIHSLILRGRADIPGFVRAPLNLFRFTTPAENASLMADGLVPWWAHPELRFAFFRPLSALTHALDYVLWPTSPPLMHAHNVLWFVVSLVSVRALYRSVLGTSWVALLALAFYAFDGPRGVTLSWIANRNALIGCAFSAWALVLHARYRAGRSAPPWASPAVLGVALLAAEGSIATLGYLVAYALFLDKARGAARVASIVPHLAVTVVWAVVRTKLGYGVSESGEYFDPLHDAPLFLSVFPERALTLLFAELGGPPSELWNFYPLYIPGLAPVVAALALVVIAVVGLILVPLVRTSATTRFFLAGALLALVPAASAFPSDRLLSWVSIGTMGVLAELGARAVTTTTAGGISVGFARLLAGFHFFIAPLTLPLRAASTDTSRKILEHAGSSVPSTPDVTKRIALYLNPPSEPMVSFLPAMRAVDGTPRPRSQHWLAAGTSPLTIERRDSNTLSVTAADGYLVSQTEKMLRGPQHPFVVGDRVDLPDMQVEIAQITRDARPATAVFHFERPLEDEQYLWLVWRGTGFAPFTLPPVGGTVKLPALDLVSSTLGADSPMAKAFGRLPPQ